MNNSLQQGKTLEEIIRSKSFAYKVIYGEDGLIVLFDKLRRFKEENISIKMFGEDLVLELGNNIMLLSKHMLEHLIKTGNIFLYESLHDAYEIKSEPLAFRVDQRLSARIQGAWEVLKAESQN